MNTITTTQIIDEREVTFEVPYSYIPFRRATLIDPAEGGYCEFEGATAIEVDGNPVDDSERASLEDQFVLYTDTLQDLANEQEQGKEDQYWDQRIDAALGK